MSSKSAFSTSSGRKGPASALAGGGRDVGAGRLTAPLLHRPLCAVVSNGPVPLRVRRCEAVDEQLARRVRRLLRSRQCTEVCRPDKGCHSTFLGISHRSCPWPVRCVDDQCHLTGGEREAGHTSPLAGESVCPAEPRCADTADLRALDWRGSAGRPSRCFIWRRGHRSRSASRASRAGPLRPASKRGRAASAWARPRCWPVPSGDCPGYPLSRSPVRPSW
jgi:hypothetical protein